MKIMAITAMMAVAGMTAPANRKMTARAELNVTVYVNNDLNSDLIVMYQARDRAARMFAQIGVRIDWHIGRPSGGQPERGPEIVVSVMEHTPHNYRLGRLAYADLDEGHITVFWDRIRQSPGAPPVVVLAHVLVHEITHILQGIDRHSVSGIMKSKWTLVDFYAMASEPLPFTLLDVELIQRGIARRLGQGQ
jgi:hypothetical protein